MQLRILKREWGCSEKDWISTQGVSTFTYYQLQKRVKVKGKYKWVKVPIKEIY